jgi:flagellar hook-associated protein 2
MTRSNNTVTDALPGMSITLKATQATTDIPVSLTVGLDTTTITSNVNDFLKKYNDLVTVIQAQTAVDTTLKTRQVLSEDTTYVQLRSNLRTMAINNVSSVTTGNPASLAAIGITADATGQLSITDSTKFQAVLSTGSSKAIADLFNSSGGIATIMKTKMDNFVKSNGILDGNDKGVKDRIAAIDKKIAEYTKRNQAKMDAYKTSLATAQTLLSQLSTQTSLASSYLAKVNAGTA